MMLPASYTAEPITRPALALMHEVAVALDNEVRLIVYDWFQEERTWTCFRVGDREFAIWIKTNELYEVRDGAVDGEPITPADLTG